MALIKDVGVENVPFVRMKPEPTDRRTTILTGKPQEVRKVCDEYGIMLVLDAALQDNLYFIKAGESAGINIRE